MAHLCRHCRQVIEPAERFTEAGFDYCKRHECLKACGERISGVAVVMVHKQGFNVIATSDALESNFMDPKNHLV